MPCTLFAVGLVTLATHCPAIWCRAVSFDDHQYVLENPLVQNPSLRSAGRFLTEVLEPSTVAGYYQPLAMISLMLDAAWCGGVKDFRAFHITSLALHAINVILIVLLLDELFHCLPEAAMVGVLFGAHPLTVEPIPWIGERKTLLAAAFAFASLLAYARYARLGGRARFLASFGLAWMAMMSKPTTIPLPLVMMILDWWPLNRFSRRSALRLLPFLALSGAFAVVTVISQGRTSVATMPTEYPGSRIPFILCHNIIFYLGKFVWPADLSAHYAFPDPLDLSDGRVRIGVIGTCVLLPCLLISLRWTRAFAACWLMFFLAALPTMQIIGFSDVIASDKYAYLPSVGLLIFAGFALARMRISLQADGRSTARRVTLWLVFSLLACVAVAEATATHRYYQIWKDSETLYGYMLARTPRSAALHNNLAVALLDEGRYDEAIGHYRNALGLRQGTDETYTNIGVALTRLGRSDEAVQLYQDVLRRIPNSYSIHCNLGALLAERGRQDEATEHYLAAIRAKPLRPEPYNNLANLHLERGRLDEAIAGFRQAIDLRPDMPETRNNLGVALMRRGDLQEAADQFALAVRQRPDYAEARLHLGLALANQGRLDEAMEQAREAVRLSPSNLDGRVLLSQLLRDAGQRAEAREQWKEILRLRPDHAEAQRALRESDP